MMFACSIGIGQKVEQWTIVLLASSTTYLLHPDAPDFFEASMFKDSDPESGLGGWGDSAVDYSVPDGGFSSSSSFRLSYPSPHTLRRNFTLRPWLNPPTPPGFITDPTLPANATFTKQEIDKLITGFKGDYKGFQAQFESFQVLHI